VSDDVLIARDVTCCGAEADEVERIGFILCRRASIYIASRHRHNVLSPRSLFQPTSATVGVLNALVHGFSKITFHITEVNIQNIVRRSSRPVRKLTFLDFATKLTHMQYVTWLHTGTYSKGGLGCSYFSGPDRAICPVCLSVRM